VHRARLACAVVCLCATVATAGCGPPLCANAFHAAHIDVWLAPEWPTTAGRVITVSCPVGAECGFLDGPVSGPAHETLTVSTVLRPGEVVVTVSEVHSLETATEQRLAVEYAPVGRQTDCGGDARADVLVRAGPVS
jgi:hypothetical protein